MNKKNKQTVSKVIRMHSSRRRKYSRIPKLFMFFVILINSSCDKFLEVDTPLSKIQNDVVFSDDATATSAVIGMYIDLYNNTGFASGSDKALAATAGLSSDELHYVPGRNRDYLDFEENEINPQNRTLLELWNSMYRTIYSANAILEGLERSQSITEKLRIQLKGEAMFVRGFSYFYLANLFGEVPVVLTTDYRLNSQLSRKSTEEVYHQILKDLTNAEGLLSENYEGGERTRPNKFTATALLSRVYLYIGDWGRSEDKATNVINKADIYRLTGLNGVFLLNSSEAIWQLRPLVNNPVTTNEAYYFSIANAVKYNCLNSNLLNVFDPLDKRKETWITSIIYEGNTFYMPYKYKKGQISTLPDEYSMVIRLSEVYLIRAEARAHLNKISEAILDLDKIRERAGVPLIRDLYLSINKDEFILAVEKERRVELFTEWGHRWFDLKRTNRANSVLGNSKQGWTVNDSLYPIPESELSKNYKLRPQNQGY